MKTNTAVTQVIWKMGAVLIGLRIMIQSLFAFQFGLESIFSGNGLPLVEMGITIAVMIYAGYQYRDKNQIQISLQEGFIVMLGVYAVGSLGSIIWQMIWANYLNPTLLELAPDPTFYSASGIFNNFFSSVVMGSILSLVFAYILSRRRAKISS
ncbi:MAG: DUF4199 family protein [Bacteroidia bacterium]|nr:DUF4199 family protein [Bacteroidia bacterium]